VVMDKGRIEQVGTPREVYEQPASAFVHEFIGESIVLPVIIEAGGVCFGGRRLALDPQGLADGRASLFIRPYDVAIAADGAAAPFNGTVTRVHGLGAARRVEIELQAASDVHLIEVDAPRLPLVEVGQPIGLKPHSYRLFAAGSR